MAGILSTVMVEKSENSHLYSFLFIIILSSVKSIIQKVCSSASFTFKIGIYL